MVFTAVSVLVSVYTAFIFILAHMIKSNEGWSIFEPQENSSEFPVAAGTYLTDCLLEENGTPRFLLAVFLFFLAVTALVMVTSEICACTIRAPTTTIVQQCCSPGFVSNPIPFLRLHICVLLMVFKQILLRFLYNVTVPAWLVSSGLLLLILATNDKTQKHVGLRLRQKLATMIVGRNFLWRNTAVHPIISIALVSTIEQSRDHVGGVQHAC